MWCSCDVHVCLHSQFDKESVQRSTPSLDVVYDGLLAISQPPYRMGLYRDLCGLLHKQNIENIEKTIIFQKWGVCVRDCDRILKATQRTGQDNAGVNSRHDMIEYNW